MKIFIVPLNSRAADVLGDLTEKGLEGSAAKFARLDYVNGSFVITWIDTLTVKLFEKLFKHEVARTRLENTVLTQVYKMFRSMGLARADYKARVEL